MKKILFLGFIFLALVFVDFARAADMGTRMSGRILLQVEESGEAWYVSPGTRVRHFLGRPHDAFRVMREQGVGIATWDLERIAEAGVETQGSRVDRAFSEKHKGKIFLQVEQNGEAWYLSPVDLKRYYLGRPHDAFRVMRELGLGIKNSDLAEIQSSSSESPESTGNKGNAEPEFRDCSYVGFETEGTYLRDLYVSGSGNDSNPGTKTSPYRTLTQAVLDVGPGDIIHIEAGSYSGGLYLDRLKGTAKNPIKIVGPASGEAVFSGGNNVMHLVKPSYLVLRNLSFTRGNYNGINIDDGGSITDPAHHIVFDDLKIYNIGSGGNHDTLKMSGVDDFQITNSVFRDGSSGGSGLDMVGCHDGVIANNSFENMGSNFVQAKGGTSDVLIRDNHFDTVEHRGINMGGSTGAAYFRPSISSGLNYEARNIEVLHNTFINTNSAVAFVGCDSCTASYNVIHKPRTWVFRILQETTSLSGVSFLPARNGIFSDNIIVFENSIRKFVNIGSGTDSDSFTVNHNLWYSLDNASFDYGGSKASLPGTVSTQKFQVDPQFVNMTGGDFSLKSTSPMYDVFDSSKGACETGTTASAASVNNNDVSTPSASLEKEDSEQGPDQVAYSTSACGASDIVIGDIIRVSNYADLKNAVTDINSSGGNKTVLLSDGTYNLENGLWVTGSSVVFRSESGDRNKVVLKGKGMGGGVTHGFWAVGSDITIADISIGEVANHAIQVMGESSRNAERLTVSNVRIFNTGEQMLKGSSDKVAGSDDGVVACSLFEYTSSFGPQWYIGGIDVHMGKNWKVENNSFKNIRSPGTSISEHAIHFWTNSENITISGNTIINCDRGIGLGLGSSGTLGGKIFNNTIYNNGGGKHDDVGIGLENARGVEVYHNTIFGEQSYQNAIEYRFAGTDASIYNNLTNKKITQRDGGSATLDGNVTDATKAWFVSIETGDPSLVGDYDGFGVKY